RCARSHRRRHAEAFVEDSKEPKAGFSFRLLAHPRKTRLRNTVCGQHTYLLREAHRYWLNLQRSSIRGKSSRQLKLCCRCPKRGTPTNLMSRGTLGARSC